MDADETRLTSVQRLTLAAIFNLSRGGYGCMPWELGQRLGLSESTAGARMKKLRELKLIEYGGRKRHGSDAAAHVMTKAGIRVLMRDS